MAPALPPPSELDAPSVNLWQQSIQREKNCRALALDYALGASLITLIPIAGYYTLRLLVVLLVIGKMLRDIGRVWQFRGGQDPLAIAGNFLGALGAMATGSLAWLLVFTVGIWVPFVDSFKGAVGLFILTWMLGQATNQYYANGDRRQILRSLVHEAH